jgi:DNA-directed RNA polymerase subunit RPC12/RpoP
METEAPQHPPWYLEPFEGESISHYFGRFRRQEIISVSAPGSLGRAAGIGTALSRWEKFRFNPRPTQKELEAMSKLIGVEVSKLEALCPPKGVLMVTRSTRLCAVCYREAPYHRIHWQFRSTEECEKHQLPLISRCPACDEKFALPSEWEEGNCKRCGMKFTSMKKRQIIAKEKRQERARKAQELGSGSCE